MQKVALFEKVSQTEFKKGFTKINKTFDLSYYQDIKIPKRATKYSAGYDFYAPFDFKILPKQSIIIPTGIRVKIDNNYFLAIVPRSSLGFKFKLELSNTIGIIDSDYYYSDNEGHIFIKLNNDNNENKTVSILKGDAFAQGIFLNYGITIDDDASETRNGGIGSTNK